MCNSGGDGLMPEDPSFFRQFAEGLRRRPEESPNPPPIDGGLDRFSSAYRDLVGRTLGQYRTVRILGAGGMGCVFEASEINSFLNRRFALKVIRPDLCGMTIGNRADEWRERFISEVRLTARLDGVPGIVPVIAGGETDGVSFYVMRLIEGKSLHELLQDEHDRRLAPRRAAEYIRQVARSLQVVHEKHHIVHRDIKPGNIVIEDSTDRAFLVDFGLAALATDAPEEEVQPGQPRRSATPNASAMKGGPAGTKGYIAPERLKNSSQLLPRSDLYSLGVTLYEALTGRLPSVFTDVPEPFAEVNLVLLYIIGVPSGLIAICGKCLARRPTDRYQSARELADDLDAFLLGGRALRRRFALPLSAVTAAAGAVIGLLCEGKFEGFPWLTWKSLEGIGIGAAVSKVFSGPLACVAGAILARLIDIPWLLSDSSQRRAPRVAVDCIAGFLGALVGTLWLRENGVTSYLFLGVFSVTVLAAREQGWLAFAATDRRTMSYGVAAAVIGGLLGYLGYQMGLGGPAAVLSTAAIVGFVAAATAAAVYQPLAVTTPASEHADERLIRLFLLARFSPFVLLLGWWCVVYGDQFRRYEVGQGCTAMAYAPDGRSILLGYADGHVWNMDIPSAQGIRYVGNPGWVWDVAFGDDGKSVFAAASTMINETKDTFSVRDSGFCRWSLNDPDVKKITDPISGILRIAMASSGPPNAIMGSSEGCYLLDPTSGESRRKLTPEPVGSVAMTGDGHFALAQTNGKDSFLEFFKFRDNSLIAKNPLRGHEGRLRGCAISSDGKLAAATNIDGPTIYAWSTLDAAKQPTLEPYASGSKQTVNSIAFSHAGHCLLAGGSDGTVWLLDLDIALQDYKNPIYSGVGYDATSGHSIQRVAFSPDDSLAAILFTNGYLRLWRLPP
jgi:serine/threonine-protein kinase